MHDRWVFFCHVVCDRVQCTGYLVRGTAGPGHGAVARRGQRAPGWGDVKVAVCAAKLADKSCTKLDAAKIYRYNQEVP